ncbi:MAG TPA: TadG family pilus assembly protein, partial [Devosia sp.]|nr:TadG family pilus assembly protein [Devosia sp.]
MSLWQRFRADEGGNFAILFAGSIALCAVISAFAVDAASLYHERRGLQRAVDLAAITAAADPANRLAIAHGVLVDAKVLDADMTLAALEALEGSNPLKAEQGHYAADPAVAPNQRFVAGGSPVNAVRVQFAQPGTLYFARSWSPVPTIGASAIASVTPQVAFSVGSRLVRLEDGIANAVLNQLLGTKIALTAVDYNGLANAKVDALAFLDALAIQLGITAGSYDTILAAKADHGQIGKAIATLLTGAQRTAALRIANAAGGNGKVLIGKLFALGDLGQASIGSAGSNLFADISALELLSVSAGLSDGTHQVALDLRAGVPGLTGIEVSLVIGEPPQGGSWYAIGPEHSVVRTAQIRLRIVANLKLSLLLLPLLEVRLPLYLDVAHAEAMAASAACPTGNAASGSAVIATRPGVARLVLGEVNESSFGAFNTSPTIDTATLINILGIKVTGLAHAEIAQTNPVALSFSSSDIAAGTIKTAKTTSFTGSLVGSLLGDLQLNAIGIPLGII